MCVRARYAINNTNSTYFPLPLGKKEVRFASPSLQILDFDTYINNEIQYPQIHGGTPHTSSANQIQQQYTTIH